MTGPRSDVGRRATYSVVPPDAVEPRKGIVAFLSSLKRAGSWTLARHMRVVATLGEISLDLRQATLAEGRSEIELFTLMGNVKVIVPPGVRVESDVDTFAANVEMKGPFGEAASPDAPIVRVRGTAVFASVEIVVR